MEKKKEKIFLVVRIISFEPGQQILIFSSRILLIGSQYVTKQP